MQTEKNTTDITICFDGSRITAKALCDTGCSLTDPISGYPAIIISPHIATELFKNKNNTNLPFHKYRVLPFSTIDTQSGIIHGFIPDSVLINGTKITKAVVGIAETKLSEIPIIFNSELLNNKTSRKAVNLKNEHKTSAP